MKYSGYIFPILSTTPIIDGLHVLTISFPLMSFANGEGAVDDTKIPIEILANPDVKYLTQCNEIYVIDDKFYEARSMDSFTVGKRHIRYTAYFFQETKLPKHSLLVYEENHKNMMEALDVAYNRNTTVNK